MPIGTISDEIQYARRVIKVAGAFRINGTTTPDGIRDGKSEVITSVARDSAGTFTVTLAASTPLPREITYGNVSVMQAAVPTARVTGHIVRDSWNPATRTFQVVTKTSAAVADPDDNDIVNFYFRGPAVDAFKDPA
jgi:hypothetical protein